jgi:methyl-accepting chemotaxis protein
MQLAITDLKMRSRVSLLVGVFVLGFITFGAFSYRTLQIVQVHGPLYENIAQTKDLIADVLPPPESIMEPYLLVLQMLEETDRVRLDGLVEYGNALRAEYERRHAFWVGEHFDGGLKEMIAVTSHEPVRDFFDIRDREFVPALLRGDRGRARELASTSLRDKYEQHRRVIDTVDKMATERDATLERQAAEIVRRRTIELLAIGLAIVGIAILVSWFIVRGIREMVAHVRGTAVSVASASQQLAAAAEHLSSGSQQQASSLEETAASLEQITGTVKQSSAHARQVRDLAVGSEQTAVKGGDVVNSVVVSMGEIASASRKIAEIISVVDEIAFQTNLLALNAAVEAARAGEHGRGFGVVAAEVRNLAQRSSLAAKEIKALIRESVQKVDAGSELVNRSGATLLEIVASAKQVSEVIAEIAAASQEQASGIEQVNRAVTQMDQVVQATAAETEELSATAQSLAGQAGDLHALLARFDAGDVPSPHVDGCDRGATAAGHSAVRKAGASSARRMGRRALEHRPDGSAEF